jgi:hypothetical protein
MFTGALAASYYGVPRTTVDADIIVKFTPQDTKSLVMQLKMASLKINESKIESAFKSGFRIITLEDEKSPFTLDIILSDTTLEKRKGKILDMPTHYQTLRH